ncbi:MAG: polymer-forming cytoskeletal protein [Acidobacteriota bacterium]|nr:polymer-forming cytoskeletal protein [Acidobacteriota bacterium]
MFEVKRKPNESQSTRGPATAAVRAYQQTHFDPAQNRVADVMDDMHRAPATAPVLVPAPKESAGHQTRTPVITGEAHYKGLMLIDGIVVGQLGANGGTLAIRQRSNAYALSRPELSGEISFKDMLRVNGHIAGTVYSKTGTLIIDNAARVDANVEVAVAMISGTVHGDIVAHQRVELGPSAKIYGNIWTRSIAVKDGAIFDGVCTMIEAKSN